MKRQNTRTIPFRRKRNGKTNYKRRLALLKGDCPRIVVRKTLNNMYVQIIDFDPVGDKVLASASSVQLVKKGWKLNPVNTPAAYLVGFMAGKLAVEKKISKAILDLGLQSTIAKSKLYAALKGAVDAGLKVPYSEKVIPSEDRIKGLHVEEYAKNLKENKEKYEKQFSKYIKNGIKPEEVSKYFEEMKSKL
ncbi:50S ribosomal protein L18 [Candidatus Woesearchaeota archaeon]|jgi:large subunit ribosomal protein L18|nr:50S ribosomal protein L18 [Candidatus Woesearchaeota archaeon]MBT6520300.1 50S ribosomal protein L18 [Candidatus Woesearchaeota archaeon]MBT7368252.1 50S ribosomal protein L18 [Candidatus Woesearchaeota archaeon]